MGLFDLIEKVVEITVETLVRLPEIPVRMVEGTIEGIEKGIDKVAGIIEDK